jgi:hypothetical protein
VTSRTVKAGVLYFLVSFAAGFLLGALRTVYVVPQLGARSSELLELPIMLGACLLAARWVTRRLGVPPVFAARLGMGLLALALMVLAELTLVLALRGMTFAQYLASRDPVSGTAYYVALAIFALLPLAVNRRT